MRKLAHAMLVALALGFVLSGTAWAGAQAEQPAAGEEKVVTLRVLPAQHGHSSDSPIVKEEIEKRFYEQYGVRADLQWRNAPSQDFWQVAGAVIAANEVDLIQMGGWSQKARNWMYDDALTTTLNDLIEEHGQNVWDHQPQTAWDYCTKPDGQIKAVPYAPTVPNNINWYYIRQDWLDQLGLQLPHTLDDLLDVLREFKRAKLGGEDTWPIIGSVNSAGWFAAAFRETFMLREDEQFDANGDLKYLFDPGLDANGAKEWLRFHYTLYEEELVHPEWFLMDKGKTMEYINQGKVGFFMDGWWAQPYDINHLEDPTQTSPPQDWTFIPAFARSDGGPRLAEKSQVINRVNIILRSSSVAKELVQYLDFEAASLDNYMLLYMGIQGMHWEWSPNGKWATRDFPGFVGLDEKGNPTQRKYDHTYTLNQETLPYMTHAWFNLDKINDDGFLAAFDPDLPVVASKDVAIPYVLPESNKYKADLNQIWSEFANKARVSGFTDAEFDEMVQRWMDAGGREYLEERNKEFEERYVGD